MSVILKAENISKQYRLGLVGTGTISHDLNRWWARMRGKEDPYLKVGAVNDRSTKADSDYVWALKAINFEVQKGEVLGIIGKNGAGKSTLLKILSRVTIPTTGEIKTRGRIASLLEVGTGFHPELTGRENMYLNGAILGMSKAEIKAKETEIIEFSGCQRYVDTPVKRYSSGMRVRLAFAVAAFLEPDILIIDEVLAVGDAEFQKKAIGKMQDISKGDGRTVLFVSHNMAAVKNLCTRAIVLENGTSVFEGGTEDAVSFYLRKKENVIDNSFPIELDKGNILDFNILDFKRNNSNLLLGEKCSLELKLEIKDPKSTKINIRYQLFDNNEKLITTLNTYHHDVNKILETKIQSFICDIPNLKLSPGFYDVGLQILDLNTKHVLFQNDKFSEVVVETGDVFKTGKLPSKQNLGVFISEQSWEIK
ncbi:ABC transporter ATP-binding protein [Winogradskyella wichelsiae]|uniref:ABC transporter ATP-binding protein n=1 Tax=Winogradskyella wichelsiae TaxID=2697007 RepID=UPI0015C86E65|nr:ABC transporter ATP-binding protein [Winogradskyella wichelsiae]